VALRRLFLGKVVTPWLSNGLKIESLMPISGRQQYRQQYYRIASGTKKNIRAASGHVTSLGENLG
jgi:hypothetical protein